MDTASSLHTSGYRTEEPYPRRFHRALNPRHMALALAAQGLVAPDFDKPYSYMELGFGQGVSLVLLAAANPHAQFYGIDLLAEHVAHARGLADAAGLTNLHVHQMSFSDVDHQKWPHFDVIAAHGVWSWITAPLRAEVLRFVDGHLNPGGLFYLSYNAMPGWAAMEPVRALMKRVFDATPGTLDVRVKAALQHARALEDSQALFFRANPSLSFRLKHLESQSTTYMAHEYFNEAWKPFQFDEVADSALTVGLTFAASATLEDNVKDLTVRAEARPLYDAAKSMREREVLKDFLLNKQFRRDLYVRAPRVLDDGELDKVHAASRFTALMPASGLAEAQLKTEVMSLKLNSPIHQALVIALQDGPRSISELRAMPALAGLNPNAAFGTLFLLAALYAVAPAVSDQIAIAAALAVNRMNTEIERRTGTSGSINARASAIVGGGVTGP